MKASSFLFFSFTSLLSFSIFGQFLKLPECSSLEVRLSKGPIACSGEIPSNINFDIPAFKLNIEDLEKIFQGAESSGGRLVGPMSQPQIGEELTPFKFKYNCEARLLADGGKKVSFLSLQKFQLNQKSYNYYLTPNNWSHYLISGNDVDESDLIWRPEGPAVDIPYFKVGMTYQQEEKEFGWEVCESLGTLNGQTLSCGLGYAPVGLRNPLPILFNKKILEGNSSVSFTLKVKCHRY